MALTDTAIKKTQASDKLRKLFDGDGLELHIVTTGGKLWCWEYSGFAKWVATLTPVQRQRRYSMDEIIKLAGIHGSDGKLASVQVTGDALHASGFVQWRDWTKVGRNRRYWKLI